MSPWITDRVFYKIIDKHFTQSTQLYGQYRSTDTIKQQEARNNCDTVRKHLNAAQLLILKQVHGTNVVDADLITDFAHEPVADASITTLPGIALAIQTADCVPVLLADKQGRVIGAAHCGWKSAKANIISHLVEAMHKKGATEIHALIGPSIQQTSYEVDDNFYHNFLSTSTLCKDLFIPSKDPGKHLFNLPQYVRRQLERENVCIAKHIEEDTYQNPNQYHSYRRDCHTDQQNGPVNMLSTIIIR